MRVCRCVMSEDRWHSQLTDDLLAGQTERLENPSWQGRETACTSLTVDINVHIKDRRDMGEGGERAGVKKKRGRGNRGELKK